MSPNEGELGTNIMGTNVAYSDVDYDYASSLTYSTDRIDCSIGSNQIPDGTVLVWISSDGNYVKMRIDEYGYDIYFTYEILGITRTMLIDTLVTRDDPMTMTDEPKTTTDELKTTTDEKSTTTPESSTTGGGPTPGFEIIPIFLAIPFLLWFRRRWRK